MAGEGTRPRPHVHGVEERWRSKFWASDNDDDPSVESDADDIATPMLVGEALVAGFTVEQLHQAEDELVIRDTQGTWKTEGRFYIPENSRVVGR
jgi:hypothetical protein